MRKALEARGVRVWMDERQISPGDRWMQELQGIIAQAPTAIVFLGPHGLGRWQEPEIEACLQENTDREMPVVPVPLPGLPADAKILPFLRRFSWTDLRNGSSDELLDRLAEAVTAHRAPEKHREISSPRRGPRIQNLPFPPLGDLLKGRDHDLEAIEAHLQAAGKPTAITQTHAIHGLGGIGKTRLAVEYAWRSGDRYDAALFVVADSPEALQSGLAGLASLNLPGLVRSSSRAQAEEVEAVLTWLQSHDRWLLILDNVDSDEAAQAVRPILSRLQGGHVLITSRRRNWPPSVHRQPIDKLGTEEAIQFLLQRTAGDRTASPDDAEKARALQERLDGLPLALEQAAAYIGRNGITISEYLEIWEKERERLLDWHDEDQTEYPRSLATTWQTTFRQLGTDAAALLRLTAYLAPDPIPLEMFEEGAEYVDQAVKLMAEETSQAAEARPLLETVGELVAYSMVTREGKTFTVHRMVQEVLRANISKERRREWIELSLRLVNDFSPLEPEDVRTWPIWNLLRPHASEVVQYADAAGIARPTSRLMAQLETYLMARGLYAESEPLIRRALKIDEEFFGTDHPEVAIDLNNLALLLKATNRLAEAEPLMRRALKIGEEAFGADHPTVAIRLNNLALLLKATNRLTEAEPLMRRALKIDEESFGTEHREVAIDLNNLALLLQDTSRLAEAEPLMRRALKIDEESFGTEHPNVARDLNNLAQLLQDTNRLAEAEPLMRRAAEIWEASLGPEHPNTLIGRRNLEGLLAALNGENS